MKTTPLTEKHIALGARMASFAGFNMPISYVGIKEEHLAVRNNVGVFDVSHMGEFIIKGKEALELIQLVSSNDASRLEIGQAQYSCIPNHEGGIVDDMLVYRLPEDQCAEGERAYMLVVNASNIEKDWNWIKANQTFNTRMINISDQTGLLAVQGPNAAKVLQPLTDVDLAGLKYYSFAKGKLGGVGNVLISATGYTGAGGFELYVDSKHLVSLWDSIFESGKDFNIQAIGLGARDTLRLEMGYCLYGNDIDDTVSPIEAGLGWITKLQKGKFNSSGLFQKQKEKGVTRKLVGFVVDDRRVPRQGYPIEDLEGNKIGTVSSGTLSPTLGIPIGMGLVKKEFAQVETELLIDAGRKKLQAKVVKTPFVNG